ncbi:MAG TPA: exopolysaccharide biosynthesis polyprenyl glycosylphosphotransferase [Thermoanaerobaculia bacterium]|nr:exopolysaccharide biosynthesis polyprenyl glycosylphosphotransferase [Thermoanaerobaculia bacterium]
MRNLSQGAQWWARVLRAVVLVVSDLMVLAACAIGAYFTWARPVLGQSAAIYLPLLPLLILFPLAYGAGGLYPGFGVGAVQTLRRLSLRTSFVMLALMSFTFSLKVPHRYSRVTVALMWLGALFFVPLFRYLVLSAARKWKWWREPAVLVGRGELMNRLKEVLDAALSLGYRPVALVHTGQADPPLSLRSSAGPPRDFEASEVPELGKRGIRVAFVVDDLPRGDGHLLDYLQQHFRHVILVHSMAAVPVEGVVVRDLGGSLGLEFTNQLLVWRNWLAKRLLDLVIGSFALFASAPFVAIAGLAIKLTDHGPAFYSQQREGLNGRTIRVWKLRTMYVDSSERLQRHLRSSDDARREWDRSCKLKDDPRIIPYVGKLLRRLSIDELPQLWNVVKGEMSLVGPRPFPDYHLEKFSPQFLALRSRVRPGMTGLWQVMIRSSGSIEDQELFDTHYIRNWSIWMDLYILAKTSTAVLAGRGAH